MLHKGRLGWRRDYNEGLRACAQGYDLLHTSLKVSCAAFSWGFEKAKRELEGQGEVLKVKAKVEIIGREELKVEPGKRDEPDLPVSGIP